MAGGDTLETGTAEVAPLRKGKPTAVNRLGLGGTSVSPSLLLTPFLGLAPHLLLSRSLLRGAM